MTSNASSRLTNPDQMSTAPLHTDDVRGHGGAPGGVLKGGMASILGLPLRSIGEEIPRSPGRLGDRAGVAPRPDFPR
jgi:hypothetical protein